MGDSQQISSAIESIADDIYSQLTPKEIFRIRKYPRPDYVSLMLSDSIESRYLLCNQISELVDLIDFSSKVSASLLEKALPEYAAFPLIMGMLRGMPDQLLCSAHRYFVEFGSDGMAIATERHYPELERSHSGYLRRRARIASSGGDDKQLAACRRNRRTIDGARIVRTIINDSFDMQLIKELRSTANAITDKRIGAFLKLRNQLMDNLEAPFLPAEIAILADADLRGSDRWESARQSLLWLIQDDSFYPNILSSLPWLFDDDRIAEDALSENGLLLEFMPARQSVINYVRTAVHSNWMAYEFADKFFLDNREILKAAFSCKSSYPILEDAAFRIHNDDDELTRIALAALGDNIVWASSRIRGDFEMSILAIEHADDLPMVFDALSEQLRMNPGIRAAMTGRLHSFFEHYRDPS